MKIGFFDSGLGGLSVFNKALDKINAEYIYLADNKNTPYGIKDKEEVKKYILICIDYLIRQGCDIIVIACNTATSIAITELRNKYKNVCIIGTEPAVKVASDENALTKKILVSATTITLKEEKLNKLIKNLKVEDIVEKVALDKLVEYVENGKKDPEEIKSYLKEKFKKYDLNNYSHLVLGCTHFPLCKNIIKEVLPKHIHVVDGSDGIIKNMCRKIDEKKLKMNMETSVNLVLTKESKTFIENFKNITDIKDFSVTII